MIKKIQVGVLFSETGSTAVIEKTQLNATKLAIKHANEALKPYSMSIEPFYMNPQSDPHLYASHAEKIIRDFNVQVIFGCYTSISRKSILPVIERYNRLLFYPTLYEGFEFSPNVIYTGACPNQNIIVLAEYMFSNYGTSCYMVGSDYVYPYESNRIMKDILKGFDGRVMGEHYFSLEADKKDYRPVITDILATRPNFVFSTIVGSSTACFYEAFEDAGIAPEHLPIASLTTSEAELETMRPSSRGGHFTVAPFFSSLIRESSDPRWRRLDQETPKIPLNQCWESAYFQVMLLKDALLKVGAKDWEGLRNSLKGSEFEAPQGRIKVDPDNNHCWLHARIGRSRLDGTFDIVKESRRPVRPDPYLMSYATSLL